MPFPEKWNMNPVARMPEPIPDLKQWVEGLGKDVTMRTLSGDEEVPATKQVKEKKRKDALSSPVLEKKNPAKRTRKPKGAPAPVLHHEAFLRIREEHEAEVRNLTEKSDSYKLLSEKLRADLAVAREEHEEIAEQVFRILHDSEDELEITTNDPILQVRQRLEQIGQLNSQVDKLMAEKEKFKKNMDILASKKEAVQAQLELTEPQLRAAKENASMQIERIKELQHRLDLSTSDKASLANELKESRSEVSVARSKVVVARSEVTEANKKVDAKVAQFRIDVEVNQAKAKSMVEHAKWQARREALEEVNAQGFDVEAKTENAKAEEARARRLAFPVEDSDNSSESEDGENPEDAASDEDQAT
ncbi:uncharacterized protein [Nicotiana tomentosiformis]|uniref:uncharacterized protein n=1 Tax=Nicotiana tomentosiformis TaxID=4098 RepID=UPI00388C8F00